MNIHGFNLLVLLIPVALFWLAYKTKYTKMFGIAGLITLVAMPLKLTIDISQERAKQDAITFDRHQDAPAKVEHETLSYKDRMREAEQALKDSSKRKLNDIMENDQ